MCRYKALYMMKCSLSIVLKLIKKSLRIHLVTIHSTLMFHNQTFTNCVGTYLEQNYANVLEPEVKKLQSCYFFS